MFFFFSSFLFSYVFSLKESLGVQLYLPDSIGAAFSLSYRRRVAPRARAAGGRLLARRPRLLTPRQL